MTDNVNLSVIILTRNEEKHIERCIRQLADIASTIYVVDSCSTDNTRRLARALGAEVYKNAWINYATQFNWALRHLPVKTKWVFRLDADEIVTTSLKNWLTGQLGRLPDDVSGIYINRRVHFMGRWIRRGGTYPMQVMRLIRFGKGCCEQRWMDEHLTITQGRAIKINADIIDHNLNGLGWWIDKHNHYALREAIDLLNLKHGLMDGNQIAPGLTRHQDQRRRWLKMRYAALPPFLRALGYFFYRYFLLLGFLDGRPGLVWHVLQGFWYRFLVDAKMYEFHLKGGTTRDAIRAILEKEYQIVLLPARENAENKEGQNNGNHR